MVGGVGCSLKVSWLKRRVSVGLRSTSVMLEPRLRYGTASILAVNLCCIYNVKKKE